MIYAQGPMANTVHNFWAMVQVYTIHYTTVYMSYFKREYQM